MSCFDQRSQIRAIFKRSLQSHLAAIWRRSASIRTVNFRMMRFYS